MINASCLCSSFETDPPSAAVVITGASRAHGTIRTEAMISRVPCTCPPRVRITIAMINVASATGQTRIQLPQPTTGTREMRKVKPSKIQQEATMPLLLRGEEGMGALRAWAARQVWGRGNGWGRGWHRRRRGRAWHDHSGNAGKRSPSRRAFVPSQVCRRKRSIGELAVDFLDRILPQLLSIPGDMYLHKAVLVTERPR